MFPRPKRVASKAKRGKVAAKSKLVLTSRGVARVTIPAKKPVAHGPKSLVKVPLKTITARGAKTKLVHLEPMKIKSVAKEKGLAKAKPQPKILRPTVKSLAQEKSNSLAKTRQYARLEKDREDIPQVEVHDRRSRRAPASAGELTVKLKKSKTK